MKILYCRVGWMESYKGSATERPQAGGKYNQENKVNSIILKPLFHEKFVRNPVCILLVLHF